MTFGIVGLGRMGAALGGVLAGTGVVVHGYDRDPAARRRAAELGIVVHDDLEGLAAVCDAVATSLPTTAAVRTVVFELGDLLREGSVVIETSTSSPAFARGQRSSGSRAAA